MNAPVTPFQPMHTLESNLIEAWQSVSQATYQFLLLLREFDLRQGWKDYGNTDCAQWLNWRCGIARMTAQEKVRVANALWGLPQISEAFRRGDLSYSKARALTRVATEINETELLDFALGASAAHLEDYCRKLRNGDCELSKHDARKAFEGRSLVRHFREDGSGTLSVELPREAMELVIQALECVGNALPEDTSRSLFAKGADALVEMARDTLAGRSTDPSKAEPYQVVVHVDAAALAGIGEGESEGAKSDLPVETVKRLCCDGPIVSILEQNGEALNVGRKRRTVSGKLKQALLARDRKCVFPGCHHDRYVDAHHIQHWANGGETRLDNLILLCTHHHTLVHDGGFDMARHPDGLLDFNIGFVEQR